MQKTTSADKITNKFLDYLGAQDISDNSLKNYKSDISHFAAWLMFKIRSWGVYAEKLQEAVHFIRQETAQEYKGYLTRNDIPESTINRRLSTLRHFGRFLLDSQVLDFNFSDEVSNVSTKELMEEGHPIVLHFEKHLEKEDISETTVKNYKSDIKQFIEWLQKRNEQEIQTN